MRIEPPLSESDGSEIAIIGLAGRFPHAENVDQFWQNLVAGNEAIVNFTDDELVKAGVAEAHLSKPGYVKAGFPLADIASFDAAFFGYSPRDAEMMDPQLRLFLECAVEALEHAGYHSDQPRGATGVYAGMTLSSYAFNLLSQRDRLSLDHAAIGLGNSPDFLATSVSYKLDLRGPSYMVQTACSSSLVAVHLAREALLNGECDMALAGGVSIRIPQTRGYAFQEGNILSSDGRCRPFDANANGTNFGSGLGIVVLKRLKDAIASGDRIHALLIGSATNNDGALKAGFTAPSVDGQMRVILEAQANAGVRAGSISYVEAHGTGTSLGDPIEVAALDRAFKTDTQRRRFCALGSVKSNIGHLDAAAGVAGLIKTVLALKHRLVPASLNFVTPNPRIDFDNSAFYVPTTATPWDADNGPRRAAVSSFGIGGTNAHAVLEEAPAHDQSGPSRSAKLVLLSAKSSDALNAATERLLDYLKRSETADLADIAFTQQVGRKRYDHRRFLVSDSNADAISALEAGAPRVISRVVSEQKAPVAFVFAGQGSQYVNMCAELYRHEVAFANRFNECIDAFEKYISTDLRAIIYPATAQAKQEAEHPIHETRFSQPLLFAVQYALASLWMTWGIRPQAMIGHSVGEYVAACLAGVLSLADAVKLIVTRASLIQDLPPGAMLAVAASPDTIRPLLNEDLSLAAINGPRLCVVAGTEEAVRNFEQHFEGALAATRRLKTSHAFHSHMLDPVIRRFVEEVGSVTLNPPSIPYLSNVSGTWITAAQATDPDYWGKHLRNTVQFSDGIAELTRQDDLILLEVGPGSTLTALARQHMQRGKSDKVVASLKRGEPGNDHREIVEALGHLWSLGAEVDWDAYYAGERRHRVPLPTYAFQRQRFWIDRAAYALPSTVTQSGVYKRLNVEEWFYVPSWRRSMPLLSTSLESLLAVPKNWIIFDDDCGVGERIDAILRARGHFVTLVRPGGSFANIGQRTYQLNPHDAAGYERLLAELGTSGFVPQKVVHLWNLGGHRLDAAHRDRVDQREIAHGYYCLSFLFRALGSQSAIAAIDAHVVVSHALHVYDADSVIPERSMAVGPCKVAPQEYPHIRCQVIDVNDECLSQQVREHTARRLLIDFDFQEPGSVIAYRGADRWLQQHESVQLPPAPSAPTALKQNGIYVIIGGTGRFGGIAAQYLSRAVDATVILIGASETPERERWTSWLAANDHDSPMAQRIRRFQALERAGVKLDVMSADVADACALLSTLEAVYRKYGTVDGIIHAAGTAGHSAHQIFQEVSREHCEQMFCPKVTGLVNLFCALRGRSLDFIMVISSLSSILGGFGLAAYSSANLFMDAFADNALKSGMPWITVNLEGWHTQEFDGSAQHIGSQRSALVMTDEEVSNVLHRVLNCRGLTKLIVATGDLQLRLKHWVDAAELGKSGNEQSKQNRYRRPELSTAYVAPRDDLEMEIAGVVESILGVDTIGVFDSFFDVGGTSLVAVQLMARLRATYHVDLPVRDLFETPTVANLAETVRRSHAAATVGHIEQIEQILNEVEQITNDSIHPGLPRAERSGVDR